MRLWKSTIVIWSEFDPQTVELDRLAQEAMSGDAYCSLQTADLIEHAELDPNWDGTEFFGVGDDE